MQMKSFLIGFGLGMVFLSVIFLWVYRMEADVLSVYEPAAEINITEEILPEATESATIEIAEETPEPVTPAALVVDAIVGDAPLGVPELIDEESPGTPMAASPTHAPPAVTASPAVVAPPAPGMVRVEIIQNSNASEIAQQLYLHGVVDNAADFTNFLINNRRDTQIFYGTFDLPESATYAEIMRRISH